MAPGSMGSLSLFQTLFALKLFITMAVEAVVHNNWNWPS